MLVVECQPEHHERIDESFRTLLENLHSRLEKSKVIRNLAHPDSPALTRTESDENVTALYDKLGEAVTKLKALDEQENDNVDSARRAWDWVFKSDGYFEKHDRAIEETARVDSALAIRGRSAPDFVPWTEQPRWPTKEQFTVRIIGRHSGDGKRWQSFVTNEPLPRQLKLRFTAETNAKSPYQVYWQVVNTGREAALANQLRGRIEKSKSAGAGGLQSTTGLQKEERTLYRGRHWVECFIVREGICVARSGPFIVAIE